METRWFLLFFAVFFLSFVSADLSFTQQPEEVYNFGDRIETTITVSSDANGIYDFLEISLICDNYENILPKEEIDLNANSEFEVKKSIFLINKFTSKAEGNCKIKAELDDTPGDYVYSNQFKISKVLDVNANLEKSEYDPGETVTLTGRVEKENLDFVNGFLNLTVFINNVETQKEQTTVNNGEFSVSFDLPKNAKSGTHTINLYTYEVDPLGETTNYGNANYNINVAQIPTTLEILFEDETVLPGTDMKVRGVLYDQSGEKIDSKIIMTLKNQDNKIVEQIEKNAGEFYIFPISYNEAPSYWKIVGISSKITSEKEFEILEKKDIGVNLVQNSLILTNKGNVPYDEELRVKIDEEYITINPNLEVDEVKKYTVSAPDGEYVLEVIADDESKITGRTVLTGSSIAVEESSKLAFLKNFPYAWIFIVLILGFMLYMFFKKGFKSTFLGNFGSSSSDNEKIPVLKSPQNISMPGSKAELSMDMTGERQIINMVCLRFKNYNELRERTENVVETLEKISRLAEENQAYIYKNQDGWFYMLVPAVTKTQSNEMKSIDLVQKITDVLDNHNKLFKQKIDYGISINEGEIIAKLESSGVMKFMGLNNIINNTKKIASFADRDVYLSQKVKDKIPANIKTERVMKEGMNFYTIKEIKKENETHKKFMSEFVKRMEQEEKGKKS